MEGEGVKESATQRNDFMLKYKSFPRMYVYFSPIPTVFVCRCPRVVCYSVVVRAVSP